MQDRVRVFFGTEQAFNQDLGFFLRKLSLGMSYVLPAWRKQAGERRGPAAAPLPRARLTAAVTLFSGVISLKVPSPTGAAGVSRGVWVQTGAVHPALPPRHSFALACLNYSP